MSVIESDSTASTAVKPAPAVETPWRRFVSEYRESTVAMAALAALVESGFGEER